MNTSTITDPIIRYQTKGDRNNHALIFLHGFLGSSHDWDAIIPELKKDLFCVAVDLPGHGQSIQTLESYQSFKDIAEQVVYVIQKENLSACSLVGYSLGGRIALYLTCYYPELFSSAVLVSASPGIPDSKQQRDRIKHDEQIARMLETEDLINFIAFWYQQPIFSTLNQHKEFEQLKKRRLQNNARLLAQILRIVSTGRQPSLWNKIKDNRVPIRVMAGAHDSKYCMIADKMVREGKNINAIIVQDSGHCVHIEKKDRFISELKTFVRSNEEEVRHE